MIYDFSFYDLESPIYLLRQLIHIRCLASIDIIDYLVFCRKFQPKSKLLITTIMLELLHRRKCGDDLEFEDLIDQKLKEIK